MPVVPLFPKPSESEVIIRKKAEQGPEPAAVLRREYMMSYLAAFGWQKSGQDEVYEVGGSGGRPDLSFWHTLFVMASLPALLSAPGSGDATTGPVPIRFRVRQSRESPVPPRRMRPARKKAGPNR